MSFPWMDLLVHSRIDCRAPQRHLLTDLIGYVEHVWLWDCFLPLRMGSLP